MPDRPKLLQAGPLMPYLEQSLAERFDVTRLHEQADPASWLRAEGGGLRAIATSTFVGLDAATIDACPRLEQVSSFGVGTDSIDVAHARRRHVVVTNTPDVLNDDTANLAVLLLLACSRNLVANDRYVRAGRWHGEGDPPLARGLAGRVVGLVGMGRIGQDIARTADLLAEHDYFGAEPSQVTLLKQEKVQHLQPADLQNHQAQLAVETQLPQT